MYTTLEQVKELNLMVAVASSYRKIAPGVRKVVLIGGWYVVYAGWLLHRNVGIKYSIETANPRRRFLFT